MRRVAVLLVLLALTAAPASTACSSDYAYVGVEAPRVAAGMSATITAISPPIVNGGHVAAWVGVGGNGFAPDGSPEWLQTGISIRQGGSLVLYYELRLPATRTARLHVVRRVRSGHPYRVAVVEVSGRPGWWQVLLDGQSVMRPVRLVGSETGWRPIVVAESWGDGSSVCNRFAYRFDSVSLLMRGQQQWRPLVGEAVLADPPFQLRRLASGSLLAVSGP